MKREFLQNLKIGDQPLPKEIIDAIMDENGEDIESAKKPFADYETLKTQLAEAKKTIEELRGQGDIEAVKQVAKDWETKYNQAVADAARQKADMEFGGLLTTAITAARGKNAKAITALLDVDALKQSKNQEADIKAALENLKKDSGYLFEGEAKPGQPWSPAAGSNPVGGGKYTPEMAAIRAAAGLKNE